MYLEKRELDQVVGGASASFFNSVARILRTAYDIGYSIGSSLRRLFSVSYTHLTLPTKLEV